MLDELANPVLSHRERDRRWAATRQFLRANGLDALVVFGLKSRDRYDGWLANELAEGVIVFPLSGKPVLITWVAKIVTRRMPASIDRSSFWIDDVRIGLYGREVVAVLEEMGLTAAAIGVVGLSALEPALFEGYVPFNTWQKIVSALPSARFNEVSHPFGRLMLKKSDEELSLLKRTAEIGEEACRRILEVTRVGVSEREIYAEALDKIHRQGARSIEPHLIMTFGQDDVGWDQPVWLYSGGAPRRASAGDLINMELFPSYGGLEAQAQLSIAIGPVDPLTLELADVARRCYDAGIVKLRPGISFKEVCDAMIQPMIDAGCWNLTPMIHSLTPISWIGHIGIGAEQMPGLDRYPGALRSIPPTPAELILEPGMVFAFEPNAGRGNRRVNIGGTVVVASGDPLELNKLPNHMQIVA